ncbi:hypothetical protein [Bradyrhizobium sp. JYMT SZCCT0180]|nr:hypothetical protein [Bradyrhizobium sp. JYMT SZCCT0180]MBR1212266.1 hypothetical protein [Bradyrhizobium sp. JYMT SZCCT0180]
MMVKAISVMQFLIAPNWRVEEDYNLRAAMERVRQLADLQSDPYFVEF